ncbi:hypothetical protein [Kitasatospora sp. CB01950]|uniref:hypothetical protein n=1 Tax=Kitasatospora sp. CB01950 TaxID=1703930 RepID=UPI00093CD80D|nr:hypothetical protein [Kitasatospora sp. CB01950]OKJ08223.1 hypothetical protein AMK19_19560 [Kitasatospora sp. CB01950]
MTPPPDPPNPPSPPPLTLDRLTDELLRLAPGLDREQAAAVLRKAYRAGLAHGRREHAEGLEHGGW